ncbi:hypothetical protein GCM10007415_06830 [Parapedobacter pyrenivorans]|uniref:DUF1735 domain-containing protein n=1 Tax=Parapedobacter pyrenivorans TaxID=1305674 RepID=A0A917M545_9SPHI|nr:DUF1735 domain-containing protein [Parapedobacter pyrenivorans]GGG77521.1 hypothetical protein GCM10007415_06830 [Parapedobacter pyrenivorans]
MKKFSYIKYSALAAFAVINLSCERDEIFEREQYKNVFALISENDNVSSKFHDLGSETIGYVAASLGGTTPTNKPIEVNLIEDPTLIDEYNRTNFDVDHSKYVRPLPTSKYDIEKYSFTIPAGDIGGRLPIRIRPDGLSPDSSYFIPLRVESHSSYEVNPEKSFLLYRVRIKNYWARADGNTIYSMRARLRQDGSAFELQLPGTKIMHPIGEREVRIMVGNEAYSSNVNVFNRAAITLLIGEDNKVTIRPYKDVEVQQIDGDSDYPNTFAIEDDGFKTYKTFLLNYYFRMDGVVYQMKEELRLEFDPDEETRL